jgi:Rrf2 family transcriptional regulator, cysteine metabolism repressor
MQNGMNISARSKYAVRALVELAQRGDGETTVRLTDVAATREMPLQFLEQVFASLRRAGIVRSRRGACGGFALARPAEEITVLEVVEVLDGLLSPAVCTQGECEHMDGCGAAAVWLEAKAAVEDVLRRTTVASLAERERSIAAGTAAMYYI